MSGKAVKSRTIGRRMGTAAEEGGTGPGEVCTDDELSEMAEALLGSVASGAEAGTAGAASEEAGTAGAAPGNVRAAAAGGSEAGAGMAAGSGPPCKAPDRAGGDAGSGPGAGGASLNAPDSGKSKGPRVNKDGTLDGRYRGTRRTTPEGIPRMKNGKPDPRYKYTPEQAVEARKARDREKQKRHRQREKQKTEEEKAEKARASGGIYFGKANPKQAQFFASRTLYTAYGGARGGGKSWAVRVKAVGGALAYPGIKILLLRRTYPELQQNHITPIIKMVPQTLAAYNGSQRAMYFKNGSTIKFGHAQSAVGIETEYQGQEYDWIFMDEATQFTESEFRTLGGCLRGVNEIPKRFYLTCNPKHPQAGRV